MDFPDLHRHLGGATHPRILWGYVERHPGDVATRLRARFPTFAEFNTFFNRPFRDLADYLTVHHLVEELQSDDPGYFTHRAVRGASVFESIDYLELRFNPYKRTPCDLPQPERLALMEDVARQVIAAAQTEFPVRTAFIFCMDRGFPPDLNRRIVDLAARLPEVLAVDLAGPYQDGGPTVDGWVGLYAQAKAAGLRTTAHMGESDPTDIHTELFPWLDRIGHGIQIALHRPELLPELAARGICLEVCPMTYLRTNTVSDTAALRPVFDRCRDTGVDIAVCTDNPALHGESGRLVNEYERLVRADVIHFDAILDIAAAGYRNAFDPDVRRASD